MNGPGVTATSSVATDGGPGPAPDDSPRP
jgi:hypothetical protein